MGTYTIKILITNTNVNILRSLVVSFQVDVQGIPAFSIPVSAHEDFTWVYNVEENHHRKH